MDEFGAFAFLETGDGDAGPCGDDAGDVFVGDFLAEESGFGGRVGGGGGELGFEVRDEAVLDFAGAGEVAGALGLFEFGAEAVDFLFDFAACLDGFFFGEPLGFEGTGFFFEVGDFAIETGDAVFGGGVGFFLEDEAFHFCLHDGAFDDVDFRGHGIEFDFDAAGGFVDEVDGFVREEAVGDVAVAEGGGGDDGVVLDADPVVDLVAFFEAAEDGDGVFDGRFADHDGLEAAFEGGVFFDVLAVLVEGGGTDAAEFAASELGFEEIAGVHGTFGFAGPDDGMEFVDEEDDLALAGSDFLEEGFEAFFEFAAEFGAGHHAAEVHADEALVFEGIGDVAGDDPPCQAFGDGGFADAWFTDEDRVVFAAAAEDLHDAADFVVAADDGVDLAFAGTSG